MDNINVGNVNIAMKPVAEKVVELVNAFNEQEKTIKKMSNTIRRLKRENKERAESDQREAAAGPGENNDINELISLAQGGDGTPETAEPDQVSPVHVPTPEEAAKQADANPQTEDTPAKKTRAPRRTTT